MTDPAPDTLPMAPPESHDRGWYHPPKSRKAHYMFGGVSLCGLWTCEPGVTLIGRESTARDCCVVCKRRRAIGLGGGKPAA